MRIAGFAGTDVLDRKMKVACSLKIFCRRIFLTRKENIVNKWHFIIHLIVLLYKILINNG